MKKTEIEVITEPKPSREATDSKEDISELEIARLKDTIKELDKTNARLASVIEEYRSNNDSFLYTALANAQAELPIISKNNTIYGTQKFLSFADAIESSRQILTKYGLSVTHYPFVTSEGNVLITRLAHKSGQKIDSSIKLKLGADIEKLKTVDLYKEIATAMSSLKKHTYKAIIGLADDD